jgi:hypothetical protein
MHKPIVPFVVMEWNNEEVGSPLAINNWAMKGKKGNQWVIQINYHSISANVGVANKINFLSNKIGM